MGSALGCWRLSGGCHEPVPDRLRPHVPSCLWLDRPYRVGWVLMAIALANSRDGEGRLSMASLEDVASIAHHKHQMFRHGYAGQTRRGCHVEAPVAPYELRDWSAIGRAGFTYIQIRSGFCRVVSPRSVLTSSCELGADFGRRPFHQNSHRLPVLPRSSRQRVRFSLGCTRVHSMRSAGCTRPRAQSLAHKQVIQAVAYGPHLSRLSSSLVSVGNNPNENGLTKWTSILCSRSKSQ